ncbi:LytTR family DNA-binding domain-containing protein [Imperialibacter roseus]|uniref:LytTR family DNA-binding domain-containing protein n=1 Tax=Imperialibacter roseus TaxID=1324217 RepID=A0ABZ0IIU4_9BACT|nr:LytTR family DNA-binding domain-containing protein [Imperialibacter roseus]WOK04950.1 LytTR family DNA-binding domain-containing protein [Imperialibacter roseus]
MKVAIIEDEVPARQQLISLLKKLRDDIVVVNESTSVKEAVAFLQETPVVDLLFMDIQLNDGLSFEIFKKVAVTCPVIFTTAFDQYMLDAFRQNGIDYLLKPLKKADLQQAFAKLEKLKSHFSSDLIDALRSVQEGQSEFRKRLVAKKGVSFKSVPVEDIQYFFSEHKVSFLVNREGEKLILDKPLADIEADLDPATFFRINRKYIAAISAIESYRSFEKGKLSVVLIPSPKEEVVVSQEKASFFKAWMEK